MKRSGKESSSLFKMIIGTIIMGVGFLFMAKASIDIENHGDQAALILLILAYLFHTLGELCISPVALSFITKLAPIKYVSFMMGVYFAATGLGNKVAGAIGEAAQAEPVRVELAATANQLQPYLPSDTTLRTASSFEIVGEVKLENDQVSMTKDGTDMFGLISIDEENRNVLREALEEYDHEGSEPLTAVLKLENEKKPEKGQAANLGDYEGTIEVFEIQDNKELNTWLGIFGFSTAFSLLLILFLKRLKKLTHGVEEQEK